MHWLRHAHGISDDGDKQRVIDETKRMIDLLAPGGGYIMTNSLALDQVKTENMEAWKDTLFTYGKS